MKNPKKVLAISTVVIIVALYITTLILALIGDVIPSSYFKASLYSTVVLPVILYIVMWLMKLLRKED